MAESDDRERDSPDFDSVMADHADVRAAYRSASVGDEPGTALDAAILAASRKAVNAGPASVDRAGRFLRRLTVPLSAVIDSGTRRVVVVQLAQGRFGRAVGAAGEAELAVGDRVREREQACVNALLSLFQFRPEDYLSSPLPLTEGRWELDLFSPQALQHFGIHVSMGVAAGAAAGATVDVLSAGLSLGTGMAIGAIAGARWGR
jgi:hypothetical protein